MKIQQVIKKAKNLKASAKIFILVAISLLILIINYFILMNDHLDFQLVDRDGIVENISTTGIVIRNEEVLSSENYTKKNLKYLLSDGERIQKNGIVAEIYASPKDVNASYRLENLKMLGTVHVLEALEAFIRDTILIFIMYAIVLLVFINCQWQSYISCSMRCIFSIASIVIPLLWIWLRHIIQFKIYKLVWEADFYCNHSNT